MAKARNPLAKTGAALKGGDWKTKLSCLILGFGQLMRGQIVKGVAYLATEIAFIWYMISFGGNYLSKFSTLGTVATEKKNRITVYGDNSFLILLFSILTIILIIFFIVLWYLNLQDNYKQQEILKAGGTLPSNKKVLASLLDENFDKTLLALPLTGIFLFTVLPILFMICIAFTNYDKPISRLPICSPG